MSVPVATLTGRSISLGEGWGDKAARALERSAANAVGAAQEVALLEGFPRKRLPQLGSGAEVARDATELVLRSNDVTTVDDLARRCGVSVRALQRLFHRYVGVSPKWVIRRATVQEAAERVAAGQRVSWASLASELGYCDQTHLIRDFRAQVGETPVAYAASCARHRSEQARRPS